MSRARAISNIPPARGSTKCGYLSEKPLGVQDAAVYYMRYHAASSTVTTEH